MKLSITSSVLNRALVMHEKDDETFMGNATQFAVVGDMTDVI